MSGLPPEADVFFETPEVATIATIQPDGRPQLTPVWIKRDGDDICFSTIEGRRKPANIRRDDRVGVLIVPRDNPYTYLEVRGTAGIEPDEDGALIEELSQLYLGKSWEESAPDVQRIIVRVRPDKVVIRS